MRYIKFNIKPPDTYIGVYVQLQRDFYPSRATLLLIDDRGELPVIVKECVATKDGEGLMFHYDGMMHNTYGCAIQDSNEKEFLTAIGVL